MTTMKEPRRTWLMILPLMAALSLWGCGGSDSPTEVNDDEELCEELPAGAASEILGRMNLIDNAQPTPILALQGGGSSNIVAARAFSAAVDRGDITVLRAQGPLTNYNTYFRNTVGATPRPGSVTTVRLTDPATGSAPGVLCQVHHSEGIFMIGVDQYNFTTRWPQVLRDSIQAVQARGGPLSLFGAPVMTLGEYILEGADGNIDWQRFEVDTLGNVIEEFPDPHLMEPTDPRIQVVPSTLADPRFENFIIDSNFSQQNREGRLLVQLAKMKEITGRDVVYGFGLDEQAAFRLEPDGTFRVNANPGRNVNIYRYSGSATMVEGQPLQMTGIERIQLVNLIVGTWPLDFDAYTKSRFNVVDGWIVPDT
jgi:cyanophycinase-like exopeptidase